MAAECKYKKVYCKQMKDYFESFTAPEDEEETAEWERTGRRMRGGYPTYTRFARKKGVTLRTLENWADNYPEFKEAYDECRRLQEEILVTRGLQESYNPSLVRFMLCNHHNYSEKIDNTVTAAVSGNFLSEDDRRLLDNLNERLGGGK